MTGFYKTEYINSFYSLSHPFLPSFSSRSFRILPPVSACSDLLGALRAFGEWRAERPAEQRRAAEAWHLRSSALQERAKSGPNCTGSVPY